MYFSNKYIANAGGIELTELNLLEEIFLKIINWDVSIASDDYKAYCTGLK
jgi:hypothetical protein